MKIKFDMATGCGHIRVQDAKGNLLFVTHRDDLLTPIALHDDAVLIGLKHQILNTNTASGVDFSAIKAVAEAREF